MLSTKVDIVLPIVILKDNDDTSSDAAHGFFFRIWLFRKISKLLKKIFEHPNFLDFGN